MLLSNDEEYFSFRRTDIIFVSIYNLDNNLCVGLAEDGE